MTFADMAAQAKKKAQEMDGGTSVSPSTSIVAPVSFADLTATAKANAKTIDTNMRTAVANTKKPATTAPVITAAQGPATSAATTKTIVAALPHLGNTSGATVAPSLTEVLSPVRRDKSQGLPDLSWDANAKAAQRRSGNAVTGSKGLTDLSWRANYDIDKKAFEQQRDEQTAAQFGVSADDLAKIRAISAGSSVPAINGKGELSSQYAAPADSAAQAVGSSRINPATGQTAYSGAGFPKTSAPWFVETSTAAVRSSASGFAEAGAALLGGTGNEEAAQADLARSEKLLSEGLANGSIVEGDQEWLGLTQMIQEGRDRLAGSQAADSLTTSATDLANDAATATERAMYGQGAVGQILTQTTIAGEQMLLDMAIGAVTGTSAMAPMVVRSFGNGVQQARNDGKSYEQQLLNGLAVAGTEYFTERLFGGNPAYDTDVGLVNRLVNTITKSSAKVNTVLMDVLSSTPAEMVSEGLEEVIADVFEPAFQDIIYGDKISLPTASTFITDGVVGALLGIVGTGAAELTHTNQLKIAVTKMSLDTQVEFLQSAAEDLPVGSDGHTAVLAALDVIKHTGTKLSVKDFLQVWEQAGKTYSANKAAQSNNATEAQYGQTQLANPDAEVIEPGVEQTLVSAGMDVDIAKTQADLLNKVFSGQALDNKELKALKTQNPTIQAVFKQRTGVEINKADAHNASALRKIFTIAAQQSAEIKAKQADLKAATQAIVKAKSVQQQGTAQRATAETLTQNPGMTVEQAETATGQIASVIAFEDGTTATKDQVLADYMTRNPKATTAAAEAYFTEMQSYNRAMGRSFPGSANDLQGTPASDIMAAKQGAAPEVGANEEEKNGAGRNQVHSEQRGERNGTVTGRTGDAKPGAAQGDTGASAQNTSASGASLRSASGGAEGAVSSLDLGIISGTANANLRRITELDDAQKQMRKLAVNVGFVVEFLEAGETDLGTGILVADDAGVLHCVRGVADSGVGKIFVCVNDTHASAAQIFNHELFHILTNMNPHLIDQTADKLKLSGLDGKLGAYQFNYIMSYGVDYFLARAGYTKADLHSGAAEVEAAFLRSINDEIFADAFAGLDAYGATASEFTGIVRETMLETGAGESIGVKNLEEMNHLAWSKTDETDSNIDSYGRKLTKGMASFMAESKMREGVSPGHVTVEAPLTAMYRATRANLDSTKSWSYDGLTFYSNRVQVCLTYMDSYKTQTEAKYYKRIQKLIKQAKAAREEGDVAVYNDLNRRIKEQFLAYQQYDPNIHRPNRYHEVFTPEPETYDDAVKYLIKAGSIKSESDITKVPNFGGWFTYKINWASGEANTYGSKAEILNSARYLWEQYEHKVIYEEFLNLKHPYVVDCKGKFYYEVDNPHGHRLRQIAQWAKDTGKYDGAIFTNVVDLLSTNLSTLPGDPTSIVAVTFEDGQAKSTANATPTEDFRSAYSMSDNLDKNFYGDYTVGVTAQTEDFLNTLRGGKNPLGSDEALLGYIKNIPELDNAYARWRSNARSLDNQSESENAYRRELTEHFLTGDESGSWNGKNFTGEVKNEGKLYIVTGIPAAGKSSSTANVLSGKYGAYLLDVDRFVERHKDYANGQNANYLHQDCCRMRDQVRQSVKAQRMNTVWPMVGYDYSNTVARIKEFRSAGYSEINIIYVEAPKYQGVARCITRYLEGGRFIDPGDVLRRADPCADVYKQLKATEGLIDGYAKLDNGVAKGNEPRVVEESRPGLTGDAAYRAALRDVEKAGKRGTAESGRAGAAGSESQYAEGAGARPESTAGLGEGRPERRLAELVEPLTQEDQNDESTERSDIQSAGDAPVGGTGEVGRAISGRDIQGRPNGGVYDSRGSTPGRDGRTDSAVPNLRILIPNETRAAMNRRGFANLWLRQTDDKQAFSEALDDARAANAFGQSVDGHTAEELATAKTFLSADGMSGVAVEADGNITSVFRHPDSQQHGAVKDLLITAISNGATKLDCYVTYGFNDLSQKYAQLGFEPVAWIRFNADYAPEDWNYSLLGTPDVVFWKHNGDDPTAVAESAGSYPFYTQEQIRALPEFTGDNAYGDAWEYRDSLIGQNLNVDKEVTVEREEKPALVFSKVDDIGDELSPETSTYFAESHMRAGGQYERNTKGPLMRMYRTVSHFGYTVIEGQGRDNLPAPTIFFGDSPRLTESYAYMQENAPTHDAELRDKMQDWARRYTDLQDDLTDLVFEARVAGEDYTASPQYKSLRAKLEQYRKGWLKAQKKYDASSSSIRVANGEVLEDYSPGTYECYLNIKNPYVVYCEGQDWQQLDHEHGDTPREIANWAYENGYDGVILDRIVDPGGMNYTLGNAEMTEAIVFNPAQIKSVTNENPTSAPDYRFSESETGYPTGSIQDRVLTLLKSTDEQTAISLLEQWANDIYTQKTAPTEEEVPLINKVFAPPIPAAQQIANDNQLQDLLDKYGALPEGEKKERDIAFPQKTAPDNYVRKHLQTTVEAKNTTEPTIPFIKQMVLQDELSTYERIHDTAALKYADGQMARRGYKTLMQEWAGIASPDHHPTKNDIALGELLAIEAEKVGDEDTALRIIADVAAMGTQAGQVVQAMSLLKKMTPSGQLYYLQKAVDRMNRDYRRRIDKGKMPQIKINQTLAKAVLESQTKGELDTAMDNLLQDIANQTPVTFMDKWNTWRYLAMLGNVRTHVRNMFGNAVFMPARFAKDLMAAGIERVVIKDPNDRTKSAKEAAANAVRTLTFQQAGQTEYGNFAADDFPAVRDELLRTGKYNPADMIRDRRVIFKSRAFGWINSASQFNYDMLEREDGLALKPAYVSAMAQYLAAHKADVATLNTTKEGKQLLNKARSYAMQEAMKATYRDFSALANALNQMKRLPGANIFLEGLLPFTKTPLNILKRGLEYSPVGLANSVTFDLLKLRRGDITANEYIDHLAAGMTGTMIAGLGLMLANLGLLHGGDDEDKKQAAFEDLQGFQNYSLQIGNVSYTIDWMAPVALPLFVGAEIHRLFTKDGALTTAELLDALTVIAEPMFSLSMLDGLNSALKAARYDDNPLSAVAINMVTSYLGQGFPTVLGQVARTIDPNRRTSYIDKNSQLPTFANRFLQSSAMAKTPVLNSMRAEYVDEWGRTDTTNSWVLRALENFLSPGYINLTNTTVVDEALQRLANATGDTSVLPAKAAKYFTVQKVRKDLTADEYVAYAKTRGTTAYQIMADLVNSSAYASMSDAERTKAVANVYTYATQYAKQTIAPNYAVDAWVKAAMGNDGVPLVDAIIARTYSGIDEDSTDTQIALSMNWLSDDERGQLLLSSYYSDKTITDPRKSGYEYTLTEAQQTRQSEIYASVFNEAYAKLVARDKYKNADAAKREELLNELQAEARAETRKQLAKELHKDGTVSTKKD